MQIDDKMMKYLEELSYISLSEDERQHLSEGLEAIFMNVAQLRNLDIKDAAQSIHPFGNVNVFRDDIVTPSLDRALALQNAKHKNEEMFIAPKTVE